MRHRISRTSSRRKSLLIPFFMLAAALSLGATTSAQVLTGSNPIDGSQEVPPSGSSATGTAVCTLNLATNLFTWNISYMGMTTSAAHFHLDPGGAIQISIGTSNPAVGSMTVSGSQATAIQNDLWYVNIHSVTFPLGEIRGQIMLSAPPPVVPSTSARGGFLLVGGILVAGSLFLARRRRLARA